MSLNKDTLGQALYDGVDLYNETFIDPADIEAARLAYWKKVAELVINHFKANIKISIPGTGLIAPSGGGAVTGTSITGVIE